MHDKVYPIGFLIDYHQASLPSYFASGGNSLQAGMESGDCIRALIAEMRGEIRNLVAWLDISRKTVPHLQIVGLPIPYREHLSNAAPTRVQDKRLAIRLCMSHISKKIVELWMYGGDRLEWIRYQNDGGRLF